MLSIHIITELKIRSTKKWNRRWIQKIIELPIDRIFYLNGWHLIFLVYGSQTIYFAAGLVWHLYRSSHHWLHSQLCLHHLDDFFERCTSICFLFERLDWQQQQRLNTRLSDTSAILMYRKACIWQNTVRLWMN